MDPSSSATLRSWGLLVVAVLATVTWIATPHVLRHLARTEPLFFESSPLAQGVSAGPGAVRVDLAPSPWSAAFVTVTENRRALVRVETGRRVRAGALGVFHARDGVVLFSSTDRSDPRTNGRRYVLRSPSELASSTVTALAASFLAIHASLVLLVALPLRPHRHVRGLVCGAAAAVAAAMVLWMVEGRLPESSGDLLGEKLRQFDRIAPEIDTVFLGSSRVYRHLDPATFEQTLEAHGERALAFNLGVPDMRMLEVLYLARRIVARSPRLRYLLVEAEADPFFVREENRHTQRMRRWHDWQTLRRMLPELVRADAPWAERLPLVLYRLELAAHRLSSVGRGNDLVDALLRRPARWIEPERRGFLSLDEDRARPRTEEDRRALEARYRDLHEAVPRWRRDLERFRRSSPRGTATDPFELRLFGELQTLADREGVELVFVISPRIGRRPNLVHAAEAGLVDRLVRFDDPERFAGFYLLSSRYDRHHLDEEAAREMTRLVALELLGPREARVAGEERPGR